MIKGSYYISDDEYVPAVLIEELVGDKGWIIDADGNREVIPLTEGKRVLLSVELPDGQKRTLTAGEITKEEIIELGTDFPNIIPKGRFIREHIEIPSNSLGAGGQFNIQLGMESIGVNYTDGDGDFGLKLPNPVGNDGKKFFIKDSSGNVDSAGGDRIIIACEGNLIQGASFAVIESAFGFFEFISNGTQWLIVSAG